MTTNATDEMLALRWVVHAAVAAGARAPEPAGAIALAVRARGHGGGAAEGEAEAEAEADTLQRYLAFMSGMTVQRGEAACRPARAPALRVSRGARAEDIAACAARAVAAQHAAIVCTTARGDGETDLCETIDALGNLPLRVLWLFDARDEGGDVAWTQRLMRRCGRSLDGVAAPGRFEAALRACSHFVHGTKESA